MQARFGHDFGAVRVHTDWRAAESARAVNALAYTVGRHVVFGAGQYLPATGAGHRLIAHELTHVVQQDGWRSPESSAALRIASDSEAAELEAHDLAPSQVAPDATQAIRTRSRAQVQRQSGGGAAKATPAEIAEYEADRARFEQAQEEHFETIGGMVREHLLKAAGLAPGTLPTTSDEALKVVELWGITIDTLTKGLPDLTKSLAGQVSGQHASSSVAQQQQSLVAALTSKGQKTYTDMLAKVRSEPFWQQYLDTQEIFIFPDLTGTNRYAGYTQRGSGKTAEGLTAPVFIIHISKDRLDGGQLEESVATLIHELSHTLHETNVTTRSLKSFTTKLSDLLADHPKVVALRQGAADPDEARQTHVRRISQMLFERTGYAEAEIFVHLQQLTHQPDVKVSGKKVSGSRFILAEVEAYVAQLKGIGLPPRLLAGILRSLSVRVELLYDRRIAAAPAGSDQRKLLQSNKELAKATLALAISQ
jgi:uncharacterized protein DUF4157